MRISYSNKFILLHIPRTGVSSVIAALDDALFLRAPQTTMNKFRSKYLWFLPHSAEQTTFRVHETARHVQRLLPADVFDTFTKIVFVRNPYSWLVSLYELVLQSPNHRHYRAVAGLNGFAGYVDWEIARRKRDLHRYVLGLEGEMLADRIGYFERLGMDAAGIFSEIGVDINPLPHVGQFTRQDYRDYYDGPTRRRVAAHWARDLELFGYEFDGPIDRT